MNLVPKKSAAAVERMLAAGAIIVGKTNTPEFGHKGLTDNLRFGPTSTPFGIGYNAGGSSGGSAAAVADGMAALAQGTDGGGSIRIPASLSGAVGFKASFGRVPSVTRPDGFLWGHPLVHIGPLTRTVADAALMAAVIAGPHPRDPLSLPAAALDFEGAARRRLEDARIAYAPRLGNFPVDPRVARVIETAVQTMRREGLRVDERELDFSVDHYELSLLWVRTIAIHYAAIAAHWKQQGMDLVGDHAHELTPQFLSMLTDYNALTAVDHALDDVLRTRVLDGFEEAFESYDFVVSPTVAVPPVKNAADGNTIGPVEINGSRVEPLIGWCMTYPVNFTGHPAMSVPAGLTPEGLPVGLQIIGRRHADESVLTLGAMFEAMQPWFDRYPGLREIA
jgi:amidase/aspartyl-tRNA(Asn)/glutamyl-tRNA(Gln) amidotransferase subunit A